MSSHRAKAVPRHVAIIMDGNGRWANRRGHPRVFGHVRGTSKVKKIARAADELGIEALTLFAFSTENWARPDAELKILWRLLKKFLVREIDEMDRENIRLQVVGEPDRLPPDAKAVLDASVARLSKNTGLKLTFAISYGSRREIAQAARRFAEDCVAGAARPEDMSEDALGAYLWTAFLGDASDVDLVIRTSGERRVSNFLLWQAAYAEFVFMDLCWPDFEPTHLKQAVDEYQRRERRFGGVSANVLESLTP